VRVVATMHLALVAASAHVACEPGEDDHQPYDENEASADDRSEDISELGEEQQRQRDVNEPHKPAAARLRSERDTNVSNDVFGSHGFSFAAD
jgi:hypothetical protein